MQKKRNITYAELELQYDIKRNTAYSLVSQKRIPHIKLGPRFIFFEPDKIEKWLKLHEVLVDDKSCENSLTDDFSSST